MIPNDINPQVIGKTRKKAPKKEQVSFALSDQEASLKEQFARLAGSIKEPLLNFMRLYVEFGGEVQVWPSALPVKDALEFFGHFSRLSAEQREALTMLVKDYDNLQTLITIIENKGPHKLPSVGRRRRPR